MHLIFLCYPEETKTVKTAWEYYNEGMEVIDREREKEWLEQMDTILIFAALFAGFLSAFLIELLGRLEPDPMNTIKDVLIYQTQMMRNSSLGPYVPADFFPPEHIVLVNALFYASLGIMLLAAFIAMLIKSWVREFDRGLHAMSIPEQRAKTREFRYLGMVRWKLPEMVGILPLLIQISLFLFFIGLVLFLFHVSTPSFGVTTAIFGIGALFYAMTTSISVLTTSSPFHSPLSRNLGKAYQYLHAYFCPPVKFFLTGAMDNTPATALGRVRRHIQIFLQKSRPYSEQDFVEPITATTVDEVHLFTAGSALQRIHDSAPNSQQSGALLLSVWQVAGSATLRIPPSFDLPPWVVDRCGDEEYLSHLPPSTLVALVAVSLRARHKSVIRRITTVRAVLQHIDSVSTCWAQLVIAVFDRVLYRNPWIPSQSAYGFLMGQTEYNDFISMIRRKELLREECLWLLSTLSELRSEGWFSQEAPSLIGICLAILLDHAPRWEYNNPPDIKLLEAVVTLAAITYSPVRASRLNILTSSREHPWLLLNIRSPNLIVTWFERTPSNYHKQLTSLLLLIVYALIHRYSIHLAVQYFTIITEGGDLSLHTSALTAVASAMRDDGLSTIAKMLVAPRPQALTSIIRDSIFYEGRTVQEELLTNHDHQLGASENPDPNIFAILLVLSKDLPWGTTKKLRNLDQDLKNPWLRLAARVVTRLDIPDESGLPMRLTLDHRVNNMLAALSLLRYTEGMVTEYTESLLLASFLESREHVISSVALQYYTKTAISYSDPIAPSGYLFAAVTTAFNFMLPDHQPWVGWEILKIFVDGFERLSVEWQRTFVEGFFTLSRQLLPRPRGDMRPSTPERELRKVLTWEYLNEEEAEPEFTESEFSGLDWMAMAWSLHLSQNFVTKTDGSGHGKAQSPDLNGPAVNEEFVLRALCKLLDAAPFHQIIPIIPKLLEFSQWFDDTELLEYHCLISQRAQEAVRRHEEFRILHKFDKVHCMWYI